MKLMLRLLACLSVPAIPLTASPLIVAHRGASAEAPENTLPAFELAWRQGADAIEGDFHLSGDGEIVCIHDFDTLRTGGKRLVIAETELEVLRELDVGSWFGEAWRGTRIPTLAEVLATVPEGKVIYIEIKVGPEILPRLFEVLEASGLEERQIVIISFNAELIHDLKLKAPQLTANWLTAFETGPSGELRPGIIPILRQLEHLRANGLGAQAHAALGVDFVRAIRDAGFGFHVWTVNDPGRARTLLDWGAQSITTNAPAAMRAGLGP